MQTSTLFTCILTLGFSLANPLAQASSAATACKAYTLLFARGTGDPNTSASAANMGSVVGPGLQTAVQNALGANAVNIQGVNYPADASGITAELSGSGPGSVGMTQLATAALASCPQTRIILGGYSQGGEVVHNAVTQLKTQQSAIVAVVTFGDPYKGSKLTGVDSTKWRSFCGSGDGVCGTGTCAASSCASASTSGHLGYGSDVTTAATFIASVVGTGGNTSGAAVGGAPSPTVTTVTRSSATLAAATSSAAVPWFGW
ncbi:hypothetical protein BP5796_09852 [Coleophoma crateriformis]|uniref:Cutinase n=1 Tax=Coleophoma crateriformis TaxID=565419 RepID=A0A3D8QU25_9HELO|nr:hypothetical protein BP5796_09852 [Coleophoma crateriformis]